MSEPLQPGVDENGEAPREEQKTEQRQEQEESGDEGSKEQEYDEVPRTELRSILAGGGVVALILFVVVWAVGKAGNAEAGILLESALPSIRFLASSVLTVGATIMALMLTLLGLSQSTDLSFRSLHYQRIRRISLMSAVAIAGAILSLLSLSLPIQESEELRSFYAVVYYALVGVTSLLGGLIVAIVMMLHRTIQGLSTAAGPVDRTGHLIRDHEA